MADPEQDHDHHHEADDVGPPHPSGERAARALQAALRVAQLPGLPALSPQFSRVLREGGHVYLGGCSAQTAQALADWIRAHARCTGRSGEDEPTSRVADLLAERGLSPAAVGDGLFVVRKDLSE